MNNGSIFMRIYHFYLEGFQKMNIGRTLWIIILIKLFIIFIILKLFFFPNFLKKYGSNEAKEEYVSSELIQRAINP